MNIIWILVGSILLIWGSVVLMWSNFHAGHFLTLMLALICIGLGCFHQVIIELRQHYLWINIIYSSFIISLIGIGIVSGFLFYIGNTHTATMKEEVVIILGASLKGRDVSLTLQRRLDRALDYLTHNPSALIVVSGGQGAQEERSEASAMSEYLQNHGVHPKQIVQEDQSTNTRENFLFTQRILIKRFKSPYTLVYISNDFHLYRAGYIAQQIGLEVKRYGSHLDWYLIPSSYLRESIAVCRLWILGY